MPSIRSGLPPASSTPFRLSWPLFPDPGATRPNNLSLKPFLSGLLPVARFQPHNGLNYSFNRIASGT